MHTYSIYGTTFSSLLPFPTPFPPSTLLPDLRISERQGTTPLDEARLLVATPAEHEGDLILRAAYRLPEEDILVWNDGDQTLIRPHEIVYVHSETRRMHPDFVEARLVGTSFAWWLLRQKSLPLHAGALLLDGEAVLFTAASGMGKSTLMCSLVTEGVPLLSDDFVAIHQRAGGELVAASAYPQMRMWPETVEQFIGSAAAYPPVFHGGTKRRVAVTEPWGRFLAGSFPVSRIYLLQREPQTAGSVMASRLSGHESFMSLLTAILVGSSFPLEEMQNVWPLLQALANQVPIYRLSYPTGWQWLPQVHRAVMQPE